MPQNIRLQQNNNHEDNLIEYFIENEYQGWNNFTKSRQFQFTSNILNVLSNNLKSYQNLYNQSKKMKNNELKAKNKHKRCSTISSKLKVDDHIKNMKYQKNQQNQQKSNLLYQNQNKENSYSQYSSNKQNRSNQTNCKMIYKRQNKQKSSNTISSQVKYDINSIILTTTNNQNQKNGINLEQVNLQQNINKENQNQMLLQSIQKQNKFKICNSYNLTESLEQRVKKNRTLIDQKSKINHNKFHSNRLYSHKRDQSSMFPKRVQSETKRKYSCQILKPHEMKFGQNVKVVKKRRDAFIELFGYKHRKVQLNSTLKDFSDSAFFIKQKLDSRQTKTRQL